MNKYYTPEGLDLKTLVEKAKKNHKNNHGISEEFIAFILHSIYNGTIFKRDKSNSAKNEDLELEVRFALLHSHILKCINSNYHNCINFLLQEGIIICDGIFKKKKESHLDIEYQMIMKPERFV
jgi:hypothetical protein